MKRIILSTIVLFLIQVSFSQDTITLDFNTKQITHSKITKKYKKGEFINLIVKNYNPLLYKVSLDTKDSVVAQPNDGGFLSLFLAPDKLTGIVANLISTIGTPPAEILTTTSSNLTRTNNQNDESRLPGSLITVFGKKLENIKEEKISKKIDTAKIVEAFLNIEYENLIVLKKRYSALRNNVEDQLLEINNAHSVVQNRNIDTTKDLETDTILNNAKDVTNNLRKKQIEIRNLSDEVFDKFASFSFDVANYLQFLSKSSLKNKYNFVDTIYKVLFTDLKSMDTCLNTEKISNVYNNIVKTTQYSNTYTSFPIYVTNDVKLFSINLKPIESNSGLPSYQTSFPLQNNPAKVFGVSSGIFFSGLYNETYTNKRVSDTTFMLTKESTSKTQLGINALSYVGKQVGEQANYIGVSFGAGMSLESKPKPRVFLGASYITGEKNKVVVSLGLVGGYVNRLSNAFNTNSIYKAEAVSYQNDVLKNSYFFSINYSFLNN